MTLSVVILNIVQLVLFCRLHMFIHDILGAEHYSYALEPRWYDWIELVAVHILRAVDLLDILSAYGIHLQNVTHQSTLAGITLFSMHIMVDIFILGKLFSGTFTRMLGKKVLYFFLFLLKHLKKYIHIYLALAIIAGAPILLLLTIFNLIPNFTSVVLWLLENTLKTLDFGDAFQIFDWQLHGMEMTFWLATLSVILRLAVSVYTFRLANYLALVLFKGWDKTVEELLKIYALAESKKETDIALAALKESNPQPIFYHFALALTNSDWKFRHAAAEIVVLEKIDIQWPAGEKSRKIILHLKKALGDDNSDSIYIRAAAANMLGKMGPSAQSARPKLVKALNDTEPDVHSAAAKALDKIGYSAQPAGPKLVKTLDDTEPEVRLAAANTIKKTGHSAQPAGPKLVKALDDTKPEVRSAAAKALGKKELAAVMATLENPEPTVTTSNVTIIPVLLKALDNSDSQIRRVAVAALGNLGPAAVELVPKILIMLIDNNLEVRRAAETALGKIDPQWQHSKATFRAIPAFVIALSSRTRECRIAAANTLKKIGPPAATRAIPHLIKALRDSDWGVRYAAADALEKMGTAAKSALPHLMGALSDSHGESAMLPKSPSKKLIQPDNQVCLNMASTLSDWFYRVGCVPMPMGQSNQPGALPLAILTSHQRGYSPKGAYYYSQGQRPWNSGFLGFIFG